MNEAWVKDKTNILGLIGEQAVWDYFKKKNVKRRKANWKTEAFDMEISGRNIEVKTINWARTYYDAGVIEKTADRYNSKPPQWLQADSKVDYIFLIDIRTGACRIFDIHVLKAYVLDEARAACFHKDNGKANHGNGELIKIPYDPDVGPRANDILNLNREIANVLLSLSRKNSLPPMAERVLSYYMRKHKVSTIDEAFKNDKLIKAFNHREYPVQSPEDSNE